MSMLQQITHWNCFRAALGHPRSFSSLVLVDWDRLIFFDPDASRPAIFIDLTLPGERARDSPEENGQDESIESWN